MPRRARPTLRCLREGLMLPIPRVDVPLDEIAHPLLAKAAERFGDAQAPQERIAAIDDQVFFKVKVQRWRGAAWLDDETAWLVAAGQRQEGRLTTSTREGQRPGQSTTPSTHRPWQLRPTLPTCCLAGKTSCAGWLRRPATRQNRVRAARDAYLAEE